MIYTASSRTRLTSRGAMKATLSRVNALPIPVRRGSPDASAIDRSARIAYTAGPPFSAVPFNSLRI
jgi:hypothetical protein